MNLISDKILYTHTRAPHAEFPYPPTESVLHIDSILLHPVSGSVLTPKHSLMLKIGAEQYHASMLYFTPERTNTFYGMILLTPLQCDSLARISAWIEPEIKDVEITLRGTIKPKHPPFPRPNIMRCDI